MDIGIKNFMKYIRTMLKDQTLCNSENNFYIPCYKIYTHIKYHVSFIIIIDKRFILLEYYLLYYSNHYSHYLTFTFITHISLLICCFLAVFLSSRKCIFFPVFFCCYFSCSLVLYSYYLLLLNF